MTFFDCYIQITNPSKGFVQTIDLVEEIEPVHSQNQIEYDGQYLRVTAMKKIEGNWNLKAEKIEKNDLTKRRIEAQKRYIIFSF